jgi:hypothetical protein
MKKLLPILPLLIITTLSSWDKNEFDKNLVIEKLQGDWIIQTSYEAFLIDKDTIKNVPIVYPTYKITITAGREVKLYSVDANNDQLLSEGSFDLNSRNEIIFDKSVGEKLKHIGYFDADPAAEKYRIMRLNSTRLQIEYTYITIGSNKQFDGFIIKRPGTSLRHFNHSKSEKSQSKTLEGTLIKLIHLATTII